MPSSLVARHIRPCITPAIHIAAMYSTTPMVEIQKCASMSLDRVHLLRIEQPRNQRYIEPIVIIATQPSAPECTWPMVQSV